MSTMSQQSEKNSLKDITPSSFDVRLRSWMTWPQRFIWNYPALNRVALRGETCAPTKDGSRMANRKGYSRDGFHDCGF